MKPRTTLRKVRAGARDIRFREALALAEALGFRLARVRGSHHILSHPEVAELLNLQEVAGRAKPYQMRQLLRLLERYNLVLSGEE